MKKLISIALVILMTVTALSSSVSAEEWKEGGIGFIQVPYASDGVITIDGNITDGEWSETNKLILDSTNMLVFSSATELPDPIEFFYSWGDNGIYMAAKVIDNTLKKSTGGNRLDQFQIAFNPAGIIYDGYSGLFFSFMPSDADDNVYVTKHNWRRGDSDDQTLVDHEDYIGKYTDTDDGWNMEVLLPWDLIATRDRTSKLDATESITLDTFDPKDPNRNRAFCTAIICYIDYTATGLRAGRTSNKNINFNTQDGWTVSTYDIVLKFNEYGAPGDEVTERFTGSGETIEFIEPDTDYVVIDPSWFNEANQMSSSVADDGKTVNFAFTGGDDPYIFIDIPSNYKLNTEKYPYIGIYCKTNDPEELQMFFATSAYNNITEGGSVHMSYDYEPEHNQIVVIDMTESTQWTGSLSRLRFDVFTHTPDAESTFALYSMALFKTYEDAEAFAVEGIKIEDIATEAVTTKGPETEPVTVPVTTGQVVTNEPGASTADMSDPEPSEEGFPVWGWIVIGVAGVSVLTAVAVVIVKKKK